MKVKQELYLNFEQIIDVNLSYKNVKSRMLDSEPKKNQSAKSPYELKF